VLCLFCVCDRDLCVVVLEGLCVCVLGSLSYARDVRWVDCVWLR